MEAFGTSPAGSLNEEHKAAAQLLQLLKLEQNHLVEADIDGLTALIEEKSKIVMRMTELAKWRHRTLGAIGFEPAETGMQAWLASSAAHATAGKSWTELLAVAQSAKELNRTNGLLINRHMTRNQNTLSILMGNPQGSNVYGPNGQANSKATSRGFVVG